MLELIISKSYFFRNSSNFINNAFSTSKKSIFNNEYKSFKLSTFFNIFPSPLIAWKVFLVEICAFEIFDLILCFSSS